MNASSNDISEAMPKNLFVALVLFCSIGPAWCGASAAEVGDVAGPRFELGIGARFMPTGWFDLADASDRSFRAYPALGGEVFLDRRLGPIFSVGLGAEVTGNVIPNRSDYVVGTLYAGAARIGARYPTASRFKPFATLTGGYSLISFSSGPSSATGALVSGWLGTQVTLGATNRVLAQVGYERGFQTLSGGDYAPSYLVTELGWLVGF